MAVFVDVCIYRREPRRPAVFSSCIRARPNHPPECHSIRWPSSIPPFPPTSEWPKETAGAVCRRGSLPLARQPSQPLTTLGHARPHRPTPRVHLVFRMLKWTVPWTHSVYYHHHWDHAIFSSGPLNSCTVPCLLISCIHFVFLNQLCKKVLLVWIYIRWILWGFLASEV